MKPGAVLFFIDNDGGGFRELILKIAKKYNFFSVFGPHLHENYTNEMVKTRRFGSVSCHKTTVSVHLLQKPVVEEPIISPYCSPLPFSQRRVLLESSHINSSHQLLYNSPQRNYLLEDIPLPQEPILFCNINKIMK
jgi:hypothetical protein